MSIAGSAYGGPTIFGPEIVSGTYTPTIVTTANFGTVTLRSAFYSRTGDMVQVYLRCAVDPSAASANWQFTITLPISRAGGNFNSVNLAGGVGQTYIGNNAFSYCTGEAVSGSQTIAIFGLDGIATSREATFQMWYSLVN